MNNKTAATSLIIDHASEKLTVPSQWLHLGTAGRMHSQKKYGNATLVAGDD